MDNTNEYLSKCAELYTHIAKTGLITNDPGILNLPTNRYLVLESVRTWFDNAIFRPIADSTRPEAAIKYMVFSVINTLSGRLTENEYPLVDPYFAINQKSYEVLYTGWGGILKITDGQFKLAVLLVEKFTELKNKMANGEERLDQIRRIICEEFFNYLTPYQLICIQAVLGSVSLSGLSMWRINKHTSALFNTPYDQQYQFITDAGPRNREIYFATRKANCDELQKEHYITRSICTLFGHIRHSLCLTYLQLYDSINILDMPGCEQRLDRYLWILTNDQAGITYL